MYLWSLHPVSEVTRTGLSVTFTSSRQNIIQAGARAATRSSAARDGSRRGGKKETEMRESFVRMSRLVLSHRYIINRPKPDPRDGGKTRGRQMAAPGQK